MKIETCDFTRHQIQWAGDGYFCSICMTQFIDVISSKSVNKYFESILEKISPCCTGCDDLGNCAFKDCLCHAK